MAIGLDNVVQSARSVAVKDAIVTDSHSSIIPLPIFSLVEEPERNEYDVVDEDELYMSPEERLERRKAQKNEKAEAHHKVTNQVG